MQMQVKIDPAIKQLRDKRLLTDLAKRLKIKKQATHAWKRVPPLRVLDVARITGMAPHTLRPDLYPRDFPTPKANGGKRR
jgi:DNA-binding transcriptional regulator YdaS (Cro superfamily)